HDYASGGVQTERRAGHAAVTPPCPRLAARRLCSAIALIAISGFGHPLRLPASIGGQGPAPLVQLFESARGTGPCEEGRVATLQQLALAGAALGGRTALAFGTLALHRHVAFLSNLNAIDAAA